MKKLLRRKKIEEQIEKKAINVGANVIIHGVKEDANEENIDFVNALLNDLNIKTQLTYISLAGK